MKTAKTIQGDTWDMIALRVYGNALRAQELMEANFPLLDYEVFPGGITINTPEIAEENKIEDLPEWRR